MAQYDAQSQNNITRNVRQYTDLDLFFGKKSSNSDVQDITDIKAVKRSIRNLVLLNHYEKPFHPEIGCGVKGLLFENYTPVTNVFLKRKIEECLVNNEPRIVLTGIIINGENLSGSVLDVRNQNADDNRLEVEIHFNIIGVPHPHSVSINLQRLR